MTEVLPILFAMGILALGAVALVLGVIAYARLRRVDERMWALERQLAAVRAEIKTAREAPPPSPATTASTAPPAPAAFPPAPAPFSPVAGVPPQASPPSVAPIVPSLQVPRAVTEPAPAPVLAQKSVFVPPPPAASTMQPAAPAAPLAATSPPASTPRSSAAAFPSRASSIDIERWLGVRGAAVLGGIVVAIAGFLFLQHSISRGWITPQMRVVIGAIAGVVCFAGAVPLRQRGYEIVASSITGAGAVLLYAASWAAHVLYGMISFPVAFAAMVAVTAACAFLARRHGSQVIAVLGLVGGFATPLVLSSGQNRPIPLFGYVLLLDFAFLFVARQRRWPSIGLLALAGTFILQALWIGAYMDRASMAIGIVVLAVFALFFAFFATQVAPSERRRWMVSQAGALLLPFAFAIYFAQDHKLSADLWPTALLAGVLAIAAGWMARRGDMPWLPFGSASGAVALAFTWTVAREFDLTSGQAAELAICGLVLALVHHAFAELAARNPGRADVLQGARGAALAAAIGFQLIALYAASRPLHIGGRPWLALTLVLGLLVMRQVVLGVPAFAAIATCALAGLTTTVWSATHERGPVALLPVVWCAVLVTFGGAFLFAAWLQRKRTNPVVFWSVLAFALPAMVATRAFEDAEQTGLAVPLGAMLLLGVQVAFAATAARSGVLFLLAVAATWALSFLRDAPGHAIAGTRDFEPVFTVVLAGAAIFSLWPIVRPAFWIGQANAWRSAAVALLAWFPVARELFVARWPGAPVFLVPLGFEALAGFGALCLWLMRDSEDRARRAGRIWFSCVAILFAAMILPLQVGREELAVTLALFAVGVAYLRLRLDSRALTWVAIVALVVGTFLLILVRPFEAFPRSDVRLWNILAYTYLLPAAAAIAAANALRRRSDAAVAAGIAGICAVWLVFAWINLEIANAFSTRPVFSWRFERMPARDLTVSIAWALYALVLLGLGVTKGRSALRWASLVLLLLTIGKVFLFDLGHLSGLYRAASVFGLGLSLLLVSVLYQRFVFRRAPAAA